MLLALALEGRLFVCQRGVRGSQPSLFGSELLAAHSRLGLVIGALQLDRGLFFLQAGQTVSDRGRLQLQACPFLVGTAGLVAQGRLGEHLAAAQLLLPELDCVQAVLPSALERPVLVQEPGALGFQTALFHIELRAACRRPELEFGPLWFE